MVLRLDPVIDERLLPSWARLVYRADAPAEHGRAPTDAMHDGKRWRDVGRESAAPPAPGEQVLELHDVAVSSDGTVWRGGEPVVGRSWGLPARPAQPPVGEPVHELAGLTATAASREKAFGHWLLHRLPRLHTLRTRMGPPHVIGTELPWDDRALYAAAGFTAERTSLLAREHPEWARVERLLIASQAARPGGDRRIDSARLDRLIAHLDAHWATALDDPPRSLDLYVTRRERPGERSGCRNAASLEQFFADRGCTVIYPPDLALPEQFALFRRARTVVGEFGSGTIWAMVSGPGTSVLQVTSSAGTGRRAYDPARRSWSRAIADARGQHYGQVIASPELSERGWTADVDVVRRAWETRPETIAPHLPR
jgi:hypothetical protein